MKTQLLNGHKVPVRVKLSGTYWEVVAAWSNRRTAHNEAQSLRSKGSYVRVKQHGKAYLVLTHTKVYYSFTTRRSNGVMNKSEVKSGLIRGKRGETVHCAGSMLEAQKMRSEMSY